METIIFNESGKNRKGIKDNCAYCGKEFIRRINPKKGKEKYCSRECGFKRNEKNRITQYCRNCGKEISMSSAYYKRSKRKIFFCCRKCKDEAQKLGGKCPEIQPAHYGTSKKENYCYREKYKKKTGIEKLKCFRCGYNEFESVVEIHHVDGNRENNEIENLIPLCANCHKSVTYKNIDINKLIVEHYNFLGAIV